MSVWTTPQLKSVFFGNGLPLETQPEQTIRAAFLEGATADDCAVLPYDDGALPFVTAVKARGLRCPVLFLSSVPATDDRLSQFNASVLDVTRLGVEETKRLVQFLAGNFLTRPMTPRPQAGEETCPAEAGPRPATVNAVDLLAAFIKRGTTAPLILPVREAGEEVTVRGLCALKSQTKDTLYLTRVRPAAVMQNIKVGGQITLFFPQGEQQYHTTVTIVGVGAEGLAVAMPDRFYTVMRKYLRIEPSATKPVHLYVLVPGQPTAHLRALDISQHGISFMSSEGIARGTAYAFTIVLPEPPVVIVCEGTVRCKSEDENGFRYGAEIRPHPRDEEMIARYIMQREIEIMGMLREME